MVELNGDVMPQSVQWYLRGAPGEMIASRNCITPISDTTAEKEVTISRTKKLAPKPIVYGTDSSEQKK